MWIFGDLVNGNLEFVKILKDIRDAVVSLPRGGLALLGAKGKRVVMESLVEL